MVWALARLCTSTLKEVATVPPVALAVTKSVFEEVVVTPFHPVTLLSLPTASCKADTIDLS